MIPSFKLSNNEIECIRLYNSFEFRIYTSADSFLKVSDILYKVGSEIQTAFLELGEALHKVIGKMEIRL